MKILLTGAKGQLGQWLQKTCPSQFNVDGIDLPDGDITNPSYVAGLTSYDVIINTAAYTNVDLAESNRDINHRVNADGPKYLAQFCARTKTRLIHFSTDFVFDGQKNLPYQPYDQPNPLNEYGKAKWAGEKAIQESQANALIIRTSWLYSLLGQNFLKTILRLAGEKKELRVVADQFGSPTFARNLARFTWDRVVAENVTGLLHFSDGGQASWYEFAKTIVESAGLTIPVRPIKTEEYPTPAQRPAYSVLAVAHKTQPWREALRDCMTQG